MPLPFCSSSTLHCSFVWYWYCLLKHVCGTAEAAVAGAKAAAVATVAAAVPTLASVRMLPWARAHLNPTGQALIISTVAGMAYFIVADKTILSMARKHSFDDAPDHLKNTSFH
uniref:Early nodulin n=1 Tax=Triticum aestivum TaxID=4565 RepID=A0A3B6U9D5_WHEAT